MKNKLYIILVLINDNSWLLGRGVSKIHVLLIVEAEWLNGQCIGLKFENQVSTPFKYTPYSCLRKLNTWISALGTNSHIYSNPISS